MTAIISDRVRFLTEVSEPKGKIVYWMMREQRVEDNYGLLFAQDMATKFNVEFEVVFCLVKNGFMEATERQYDFMIKGLEEVALSLEKKNIKFTVLVGDVVEEISNFVKGKGMLLCDFFPVKIMQKWRDSIVKKVGKDIPIVEVDSHNIVPCWIVSEKQEYAAHTFRPKVTGLLKDYLVEFPKLEKQRSKVSNKVDWSKLMRSLKINREVAKVDWLDPGESAAKEVLDNFVKNKIKGYASGRNDPNLDAVSNLSPYLHFGQISAQRVALEVKKVKDYKESKHAFLEELIVRKELTDNYCHYNQNHDSVEGFPEWSKKTLKKHEKDKREYIYSLQDFEKGKTHDELWNAAQMQLVKSGKMHGYIRMYWAKKILEWTKNAEDAFKIALYLNDRYELDGRDPNGYVGVAWSIGGVHDRPWFERKIFGQIRYMNFNGCKKKFDVEGYIETWLGKEIQITLI